jgi:hypothetical protein
MKRIIAFLLLIFCGLSVVMAQDIISIKSGGEMKVRIIKLNPTNVIFIPESSYDTTYMPRNEISRLQYSTGIIIYLEEDEIPVFPNEPGNDSLFTLGKMDATRYYKGYKPAAIATMISSIYFPFGVIPAIACSATRPSAKSLGYKDPKLMEDPNYYDGYTKTAHNIKKKKVWGGFAIGSGFVILIAIVMSGVIVTIY